jgi:hypothetical protein
VILNRKFFDSLKKAECWDNLRCSKPSKPPTKKSLQMYPNISWKIPLKFQSSKALQNPQLVFTGKTTKKQCKNGRKKLDIFTKLNKKYVFKMEFCFGSDLIGRIFFIIFCKNPKLEIFQKRAGKFTVHFSSSIFH